MRVLILVSTRTYVDAYVYFSEDFSRSLVYINMLYHRCLNYFLELKNESFGGELSVIALWLYRLKNGRELKLTPNYKLREIYYLCKPVNRLLIRDSIKWRPSISLLLVV